jgi:two-component system chemotaxis response regulator CheB
MGAMVRVLVAEDSVTARELLVEMLRSDPEIEVAGEAKNGVEAVEMTRRLRPSVVTMDIRMPTMDGFEATRQIMVEVPTPIVIVSANYNSHDVETSMHALRLGALALLPKPPGPGAPDFDDQRKRFAQTIKAMSAVKVVRRWADPTVAKPPPIATGRTGRPRVVAIAASTGGPAALARILSELPVHFPLPVLIVQHIAKGFAEGLAGWLNTTGSLRVKVAEDGEPLLARTVYVAPDDRHLGVADRSKLAVSAAAPVGGFRPSGTFLFESVARVFGPSAVGVILTGMGEDGVAGLASIRRAGGAVLVQDEATSIVYGMPGAAVAAGLGDTTIPLGAIAWRLGELAVGPSEGPHDA